MIFALFSGMALAFAILALYKGETNTSIGWIIAYLISEILLDCCKILFKEENK